MRSKKSSFMNGLQVRRSQLIHEFSSTEKVVTKVTKLYRSPTGSLSRAVLSKRSGQEAHGDKTLLNVTKLFNVGEESCPREIIVTLLITSVQPP